MIYDHPAPDDPIDQGDLIDGCPVVRVTGFEPEQPRTESVQAARYEVRPDLKHLNFSDGRPKAWFLVVRQSWKRS